jgi:hypothetical protein
VGISIIATNQWQDEDRRDGRQWFPFSSTMIKVVSRQWKIIIGSK